jgi:predicted CoA-binding protein
MQNPTEPESKRILENAKHIAVVGMSTDAAKPAGRIPRYLIARGYDVIPVNPTVDEILGRKSYRSLSEVPGPIDIVNVFRPGAEIPAVIEAVVQRDDIKVVWLQEGIRHDDAVQKAIEKGVTVIQDTCIYKMHRLLLGGDEPRRASEGAGQDTERRDEG